MENQNMKAKLKAVTRYDFEDDKGKRVYGTNVWLEGLEPVNDENAKGFVPKKISYNGDLAMYDRLERIPANTIVELVTKEQFGSRGIITKIVDFIPSK